MVTDDDDRVCISWIIHELIRIGKASSLPEWGKNVWQGRGRGEEGGEEGGRGGDGGREKKRHFQDSNLQPPIAECAH